MCAELPLWQLRGISCHFGNLAYLFLISLNFVYGLVMLIHVHLLANTSNFVSGKAV
jgi:hypothetical protein